jgi:hypothetical protein
MRSATDPNPPHLHITPFSADVPVHAIQQFTVEPLQRRMILGLDHRGDFGIDIAITRAVMRMPTSSVTAVASSTQPIESPRSWRRSRRSASDPAAPGRPRTNNARRSWNGPEPGSADDHDPPHAVVRDRPR